MSALSATANANDTPWGASSLPALNAAGRGALPAMSSRTAPDASAAAGSACSDTVSLSNTAQMLGGHNNKLGSTLLQSAALLGQATVNAAVEFVNNFAKSLFGAAASGMQLHMDSGQLSAHSSFSSTVQATHNGQTQTASESDLLQESSDFVGTGTMVTADGQKFTFQVEVQLQAVEQVSTRTQTPTSTSTSTPALDTTPATTTTAVSLPAQSSTPAPSTATATATATGLGSTVQYPGSLQSFLSLLNHGGFSQPIQLNSPVASAGPDGAVQAGVLQFSLLNQLPAADTWPHQRNGSGQAH